jgi:hypothetical protein
MPSEQGQGLIHRALITLAEIIETRQGIVGAAVFADSKTVKTDATQIKELITKYIAHCTQFTLPAQTPQQGSA